MLMCPDSWLQAAPRRLSTLLVTVLALAVTPLTAAETTHVVGSGHFVQVEVPDQLNPMLAAFLADKVG